MADARGRRITITDRGRRRGVPGQRQDDRVSRLSAGLRRRLRRSARPTWPTARRCCRDVDVGETLDCRELGAEEPHHAAAQSLQRSRAHPGAWKRWASAGRAPTPRSSTRSWPASTSSSKRQRAGAHLDGLRRLAVARRPPARPGRLPVHRRDGRRAGRHQPRRDGPRRLSAGVLLRQRAPGAEAAAGRTRSTRSTPATSSRISIGTARGQGERRGLRARRPLRAVPGARRAPGQPARGHAARRTDAASWRWRCSTRPRRARSRWASVPRRTSRCSCKVGRFGPYVQRGTAEDEEKPQNASLLKGMKPEDVTLEVALKLLSLPRDVGRASRRRASRSWPTTAASAPT